jgi:hypothetical protein
MNAPRTLGRPASWGLRVALETGASAIAAVALAATASALPDLLPGRQVRGNT